MTHLRRSDPYALPTPEQDELRTLIGRDALAREHVETFYPNWCKSEQAASEALMELSEFGVRL